MAQVTKRELPGHSLPYQVASTINPRKAVRLGGTSAVLALPVGSNNLEPVMFSGEATTTVGEIINVFEPGNIIKAVAAASLGAAARVLVGSTNGDMIPVVAASVFAASGHWEVGRSESAAAAGEVFALYFDPRKAA